MDEVFLCERHHRHAGRFSRVQPTLCDPMDCSPPGSSVHGILQAGILEWAAISSSGGSSPPYSLCLLHWQAGSLPLAPLGKYWEQELSAV